MDFLDLVALFGKSMSPTIGAPVTRVDNIQKSTTLIPKTNEYKQVPKTDDVFIEYFNTLPKDGTLSAETKNWKDPGYKNALLDAQVWIESRGNPKAVSPAGARGLTQFMPITWKEAKRQKWVPEDADIFDPEMSLQAQERLMDVLYNRPLMQNAGNEKERIALTLAAYNAGYGRVRGAVRKAEQTGGHWLDNMSRETKNYIPKITHMAEQEYIKDGVYAPKYNRNIDYSN